jgi:hypothetical protein
MVPERGLGELKVESPANSAMPPSEGQAWPFQNLIYLTYNRQLTIITALPIIPLDFGKLYSRAE